MLYREIEKELNNWKNDKNKLPLIVRGARQVGKTFIIDLFAKKNYKKYIYINFEKEPELKSVFDGNLDEKTILQNIKLIHPEYEFIPHETLIFFDEIQKGGNCRTALKFLSIEKNYDIICSGSLLGLYHNEVSSFPVGYVKNIEMFSLNFSEFCKCMGVGDDILEIVKKNIESLTKIDDLIHKKFLELFSKYIILGGMPQVINNYLEYNDYYKADDVKKDLIMLYRDDISKYSKSTDKEKILACFDSIPRHLSKDYKKFKYSELEKNGSKRKYSGALEFLYDAHIINYCYNLSKIEFPFEGYAKDNEFKVYMSDTGLLMSMLGTDSIKQILNMQFGIYKGAIYENIVSEMLVKRKRKLYYFEKNNSCEIDFIINYKDEPTLLEVKSSENTKAKSVKTLIERNEVNKAIKLSKNNISINGNIINMPLYAAEFIK